MGTASPLMGFSNLDPSDFGFELIVRFENGRCLSRPRLAWRETRVFKRVAVWEESDNKAIPQNDNRTVAWKRGKTCKHRNTETRKCGNAETRENN